jgi:hypothetical protein
MLCTPAVKQVSNLSRAKQGAAVFGAASKGQKKS